jgi:hypothetical protein
MICQGTIRQGMIHQNWFRKLLVVGVVLGTRGLGMHSASAQAGAEPGSAIAEQKKAVVFIFGTIHPLSANKAPMTDRDGGRTSVDVPVGTGFFVNYVDQRWPGKKFPYLVTAKHVLQDVDGSLLTSVKIRMNLKSAVEGRDYGFIEDIAVTDAKGQLAWLQSENAADDVVALPLAPNEKEFDFGAISTRSFLKERVADPNDVSEGDELYFIGLMQQYYGVNRNYPLVRRGSVALLTDEAITTPSGGQKLYIAQLESWPGNSGSPVFLMGDRGTAEEKNLRFLGMVVGSFLNRVSVPLGGGGAGRQLEGGDMSNTGITCVVPASVLMGVLDSASARQGRAAGDQVAVLRR